jgi:adenylate cyclase
VNDPGPIRQAEGETVSADGGYRIRFVPADAHIQALIGDTIVADSTNAMRLHETRLRPVYYFPRADVRMDLLKPSQHRTYCPFRGTATYWDLVVGETTEPNTAWSYEAPYPGSEYVKDYVAFVPDRVDRWYRDNVAVGLEQDDATPLQSNPLAAWILKRAWESGSTSELLASLAQALQQCDVPLLRLTLHVRTLHPLLSGAAWIWRRGTDEVQHDLIAHEVVESAEFINSPLMPIFEGAGGIRRRLGDDDLPFDFPILNDLYEIGATDYVAMPLVFSDGQINALTLTSDVEGGFTTEHLGHVYEIAPLLGRLVEVFASRYKARTLLETYLGERSGREVLSGIVKRGDGRDIHAVIWFSDLRDSTALAASMSRTAFLQILSDFFDCMAGAVIAQGGEVLRFIGDAALAIFPMEGENNETRPDDACERALLAALDATDKIAECNERARGQGDIPIGFGIGLHIGDVTYGNIGTGSRLEFTVVGAAANEAARIEGLCKSTGEPVLVSGEFARHHGGAYRSLGEHCLSGVGRTVEVLAPGEEP